MRPRLSTGVGRVGAMALVGVGQRSKRGLRLWCGRLGGDGESSLGEPLVPVVPGTVRWWPVGGSGRPGAVPAPERRWGEAGRHMLAW